MFITLKVDAGLDVNGNGRRGWMVFHALDGAESAQWLGFIPSADFQWQEVRQALVNLVHLGDMTVTPAQYRRWMRESNDPASLRRVGDAIEGN